MVRFRFTARSDSTTFALGSIAVVDRSKHPILRLLGRQRRGKLLDTIVSEWSVCEADDGTCADLEDFRQTLIDRTRDRVRDQQWGFVWWLPLVMAAIEIIIKLLIERWTQT